LYCSTSYDKILIIIKYKQKTLKLRIRGSGMKNNLRLLIDQVFKKYPSIILHLIGITCFELIVYWFVYQTGGTKFGYLHLMYIPIILSGIFLRVKGGIFFGVLAGFLMGPLMPIDTITNEPQLVFNWVFRMSIFVMTGLIVGIYSNRIQKNSKKIIKLYTHHQETGLPNLSSLHSGAKASKDKYQSIITVLIKDFDSILHLVGRNSYYELFKETYKRLYTLLPGTDIIHADNNKIWLCIPNGQASIYVEQILETLNQTFYIDHIPLYVEFSLGILDVKEDIHLIQLLRQSDEAAYYAQQMNMEWATYTPKLFSYHRYRELLGMFHEALTNQELEVYYQPKVDLKNQNKPMGLEALIRWNHPNQGFISPAHFIPVVERTQLINVLTEFVLRDSLKLLQQLKEQKLDLCISINISAKNFQYSNFIEHVMELISPYQIQDGDLEFEITESTLIENPDLTYAKLKQLREHQIQLAIDDFGTGYSSLSYLSTYPIQKVKLDHYFIQRMLDDQGTKKIVQATIDIVHELGMKVVAEGVETKEVEKSLFMMGADYAQGFLYAKPMKKCEINNWFYNQINS
jgi:diguanylate cyclase